jgi:hypothetical protein
MAKGRDERGRERGRTRENKGRQRGRNSRERMSEKGKQGRMDKEGQGGTRRDKADEEKNPRLMPSADSLQLQSIGKSIQLWFEKTEEKKLWFTEVRFFLFTFCTKLFFEFFAVSSTCGGYFFPVFG